MYKNKTIYSALVRCSFSLCFYFCSGYYSVDTKRVRKTMRVVTPALDDLSGLGEYIKQECLDKATYRLEKSTSRSKTHQCCYCIINNKLSMILRALYSFPANVSH
jgi:hypothetical protein